MYYFIRSSHILLKYFIHSLSSVISIHYHLYVFTVGKNLKLSFVSEQHFISLSVFVNFSSFLFLGGG